MTQEPITWSSVNQLLKDLHEAMSEYDIMLEKHLKKVTKKKVKVK